ncbi:MAG: hypothetical protein JRJ84_02480, partial [Deltaproteobacteria bacterium]|nr:hypothetical protein [Deltaproteobacteria bacterium]
MTRHIFGTALLLCVCACRQEAPPDVDAHLAALCAVPPTGLAVLDTEGLVSLDLPPKAVPIAMTVSLTLKGATVDGAKVAGWPAPD